MGGRVCMYVRGFKKRNSRVTREMFQTVWNTSCECFEGFKKVSQEYWLNGYLPRKEDRRLKSLESSTILKYEWKIKITNKDLKGLVAFTVKDLYFAGLFSTAKGYFLSFSYTLRPALVLKTPLDMEPHPLKYYSVHQPRDKTSNVLTSDLIILTLSPWHLNRG